MHLLPLIAVSAEESEAMEQLWQIREALCSQVDLEQQLSDRKVRNCYPSWRLNVRCMTCNPRVAGCRIYEHAICGPQEFREGCACDIVRHLMFVDHLLRIVVLQNRGHGAPTGQRERDHV